MEIYSAGYWWRVRSTNEDYHDLVNSPVVAHTILELHLLVATLRRRVPRLAEM